MQVIAFSRFSSVGYVPNYHTYRTGGNVITRDAIMSRYCPQAHVDERSGSLKQQIMQYKADAEAVGVVFLNHVLESYSVFQVNLT